MTMNVNVSIMAKLKLDHVATHSTRGFNETLQSSSVCGLSLALPDSHINGPASQDTYSQDYAN